MMVSGTCGKRRRRFRWIGLDSEPRSTMSSCGMNFRMRSRYLFLFDRPPREQCKNLRHRRRPSCFAELFHLVAELAGTRRGEFDLEPAALQAGRNAQADFRMKLQRLNPLSNVLFSGGQPRVSRRTALFFVLLQPAGPPAARIGFEIFDVFRG